MSYRKPNNLDKNLLWTTYNCEHCGQEVTKRTCDYNKSEHHYCGRECYWAVNRGKNHYKYAAKIVKCGYCDNDIERNQSRLKAQEMQFCDSECHHKWMKENGPKGEDHPIYNRTAVECDNCGETLLLTQWECNRSDMHYCDRDCMKEHRNKIGFYKLENNFNWQGGLKPIHTAIRNLDEYKQWRNNVYRRDHYKCVLCESKDIHAHHLIPLGLICKIQGVKDTVDALDCSMLWNVSNGVTLCKECHNELHSMYGNRNCTAENFEEFKQLKIA